MSKKTILLQGPDPDTRDAAYGGGQGGVVRNMLLYLNGFESEGYELVPCFHSVRQKGASRFSFVKRLAADVREVLRNGRSADGIHIFAQYRTAIYREFSVALACQGVRLPYLYHIKAGYYIDWLESCRAWERWMAKFILARARVVLCEGQIYVEYLRNNFGIEAHYFPNFVLDDDILRRVETKLQGETIRILFVGYCYEGKGVFELVQGCEAAANDGIRLELTLVGQEDEEFTRFLDSHESKGLSYTVNRMGRKDHDDVLALFNTHDVFCMPTRHKGEGHTNTVNEAMMMGMVIVATRHGFLEHVLAGESSFFLVELTPADIAGALHRINSDRDGARRRAANARERVMKLFTSGSAFSKLSEHYETLTSQ